MRNPQIPSLPLAPFCNHSAIVWWLSLILSIPQNPPQSYQLGAFSSIFPILPRPRCLCSNSFNCSAICFARRCTAAELWRCSRLRPQRDPECGKLENLKAMVSSLNNSHNLLAANLWNKTFGYMGGQFQKTEASRKSWQRQNNTSSAKWGICVQPPESMYPFLHWCLFFSSRGAFLYSLFNLVQINLVLSLLVLKFIFDLDLSLSKILLPCSILQEPQQRQAERRNCGGHCNGTQHLGALQLTLVFL